MLSISYGMVQSQLRSISPVASAAIVILVVIVTTLAIYIWVKNPVSSPKGAVSSAISEISSIGVKVEAIYAGPGYILAYVHSLGGQYTVTHVYLYDGAGRLLGDASISPPVTIDPGKTSIIAIPLANVRGRMYTGTVRLVFSTSTGLMVPSTSTTMTVMPASTMIGLVIGRSILYSNPYNCPKSSLNPAGLTTDWRHIHWVYANLVTGQYIYRFIDGKYVFNKQGRGIVVKNTNKIDLRKIGVKKLLDAGPVIVFINPTRASTNYRVTITDINGHTMRFTLYKLVNDPSSVIIDALACFEDLWTPYNKNGHGFNYGDHVVRITIFRNNTVRIEVLWASGWYLHMFMYNPSGLPPFDSVPEIVKKYIQNSCDSLTRGDSVIYVKAHLAWYPYHGSRSVCGKLRFIWDPVHKVWRNPCRTIIFMVTS